MSFDDMQVADYVLAHDEKIFDRMHNVGWYMMKVVWIALAAVVCSVIAMFGDTQEHRYWSLTVMVLLNIHLWMRVYLTKLDKQLKGAWDLWTQMQIQKESTLKS